jgi:hypothetical protein
LLNRRNGSLTKDTEKIRLATEKLTTIYNLARKSLPTAAQNNQPEIPLEQALEFLKESLHNPPVAQKANEKFLKWMTWVGSLSTTALSTYFSVVAFGDGNDWGAKILNDVPHALGLFGLVWMLQMGINRYWDPTGKVIHNSFDRVSSWVQKMKQPGPQINIANSCSKFYQ